jgi:pyruvate/2-oxoglutarate dehydrogenase complex dihydrolipoamide acyltransferase (E2) component
VDDGVLLKRVVAEGETAPINSICAWVGAAGEAVPETPGGAAGITPAPRPTDAPVAAAPAAADHAPAAATAA